MNKYITISLSGFVVSSTLILLISAALIEDHAASGNLSLYIGGLVLFGILWILSSATLFYHAVKHYRETRGLQNPSISWERYNNFSYSPSPQGPQGPHGPLVPAASAPPLYETD